MYERSAIVLERYFENLLEYRREGNIKENFNNYCDLVEKLEKYQINYQKELTATDDFNESIEKVRLVQASQEKLYKKSVKLEYSRNLLFGNIDGKVEDTRKCIEKIEVDVEKNNELMKESKENLIEALNDYNEKRLELGKCRRYRKIAENAYNEALENARANYEGITQEAIALAKEFAKFDNQDDIVAELEDNGKNEKIPFNQEVIENATIFGVDVAKKETVGYLVLYDKMTKLLSDIDDGATKIELHKKYARNEKAKMDFLYAAKDYIVQFLDYERMTVIHGRKSHNRLMSEACENFSQDIVQINNLFELLLREIANKATKKAYKELYNKSYLIDIQEKEEKFKKEKSRVNLNTATLINSNYWRIEGITEIYTIFYKNVSEVFGKSVDEFDLPKAETDDAQDDSYQDENEEIVEEIKEKAKIPFEINKNYNSNSGDTDSDEEDEEDYGIKFDDSNDYEDEEDDVDDEIIDNSDSSDDSSEGITDEESYHNVYDSLIGNVVEEFQEGTEDDDFDIFGEKYKNIDFSETPSIKSRNKSVEAKESTRKAEIKFDEDDFYDYDDDTEEDDEGKIDIPYEVDEEEEDLFVDIKPAKRQRKGKNEIETIPIEEEESSSKAILKKMRKISNVKKKKTESDIW